MNKEVYFFGFKFRLIYFLLLGFGWTFFLIFVWPVIIGCHFFIPVVVPILSLTFAGIVNSKIIFGLLVLFHINKKIVVVYQNIMLVLGSLLCTWIYSWFVKMDIFVFLDHLIINTFTVFLYYTLVKAVESQSEQDDDDEQ